MIKVECSHCGQTLEGPDELASVRLLDCPTCGNSFKPVLPLPSATKEMSELAAAQALRVESAKIRKRARETTCAAIFLAALGLLGIFAALSSISSAMESSDTNAHASPADWIFAGACFGSALALYLIAQVIHIRANTHR